MRPDPSYDPAVQPVEEFSDVSPFVIVTPTPQNRIQFFDQLLGREWDASLGKRTYLILEATDGPLAWVRIERPRPCGATDLILRQLELLSSFDLVAEKVEAVLDMYDARLLRMQFHAQLLQNPKRCCYRCSRFLRRFTGDYPVVCVPR